MQITLMNLKSFWEQHKARRWGVTAATSAKASLPKPFQPLTRQESLAILVNSIRWLRDEAKATLKMPDCPANRQRRVELRARDRAIARDFLRLNREQQD